MKKRKHYDIVEDTKLSGLIHRVNDFIQVKSRNGEIWVATGGPVSVRPTIDQPVGGWIQAMRVDLDEYLSKG